MSEWDIVLLDCREQVKFVARLDPAPYQSHPNGERFGFDSSDDVPIKSNRFMTDEKPQKATVCCLAIYCMMLNQSFVLTNRMLKSERRGTEVWHVVNVATELPAFQPMIVGMMNSGAIATAALVGFLADPAGTIACPTKLLDVLKIKAIWRRESFQESRLERIERLLAMVTPGVSHVKPVKLFCGEDHGSKADEYPAVSYAASL